MLVAGNPPVIRVDGKGKVIDSTPTETAEITEFLSAALSLPNDPLGADSTETYLFSGSANPVNVKKVVSNGALSLQIYPAPTPEIKPELPETLAQTDKTEVVSALLNSTVESASSGRLDELLTMLINEGASDLHLCTGSSPFLRKDGGMVELSVPAFTNDQLHEVLMEIIPDRNRIEFTEKFDTDFAYEIPGLARFRCNYFQDRKGCGAVFRQIPVDILTAEQLGLPPQLLRLCNLTKGLVLVTGPTGSGKSTTLAALIDHINKTRNDHIITIEDPIEFVHSNQKCLVNQREVNVHTKGFKEALRAALREDPDIVLVGELRDLETISIAVETAETGHLVFGTLHTTTAVSTIDRIIDQYPADQQGQIRVMLSESLRGVISQTLCKKQGGGRVAALEILLYTRAVGNLIREGKSFQIPSAMQTGKKEGMMLLNDSLVGLVESGTITADEAFVRSVDKDGIEPLLADKGLTLGVGCS
ncbi:MAG: twitching motility protein PilT [Candidatus Krumholzibacteriia bacterium]